MLIQTKSLFFEKLFSLIAVGSLIIPGTVFGYYLILIVPVLFYRLIRNENQLSSLQLNSLESWFKCENKCDSEENVIPAWFMALTLLPWMIPYKLLAMNKYIETTISFHWLLITLSLYFYLLSKFWTKSPARL
jgi:hypothetical protein